MTCDTASDNCNSDVQHFLLPDAELMLRHAFLNHQQSHQLLQQLVTELPWQQPEIRLFGKPVKIPRQQVWMGDEHCEYRYSATTFQPEKWHPALKQLAADVSAYLSHPFNCVLVNYYQNGDDHMGWHADDEPELGPAPKIASISLGQSRRFDLKHRITEHQLQLTLTDGSLLLMAGQCQHQWLHRLPKQVKMKGARINLTFRYIPKRVSM